MHADLAMLDEAILATMYKLNRVFHRDDVIVSLQIRVIHHGRERGRLAGSGWSGHKHHALLQHWKFFQDRREIEFLNRQNLGWNQTKDRRDTIFLLEKICTIPGLPRNFVAKVDVGRF